MNFIALCVIFSIILPTTPLKYSININQGTVIGTQEATVFGRKLFYAFYGIPYAQAPVKMLRFKNPKPPLKWKKEFDASLEYHGACAQSHITQRLGVYGVEDCLRLNVFTPTIGKPDLKPVIVWIHGHMFTSSFSHIHGADFLVENDVVIVTVTHRIGAFGFLKLNDSDTHSNMGLRDIVMALKWIRKNIKMFCGDKNNLTVMGSSSAATYLSLFLMSKYKKLFSKMILQSGGIFSPSLFQTDTATERTKLIKELAKLSPKDLMNASAKDILHASLKIQNKMDVIHSQRPLVPFSPIIEKVSKMSIITQTPTQFFKYTGNVIDKPLLIGFSTQESMSEVIPFLQNPLHLKLFNSYFKFMIPFSDGCKFNYNSKMYQDVSNKIKQKYFKDSITEKSVNNFLTYSSHLRKYPVYEFIKTNLLINSADTFVYKFNYVGNLNVVRGTATAGINMKIKGAASGDEVCYLFKCEPFWETYVKALHDTSSHDKTFIAEISKLWTNFAKRGDPNSLPHARNVTWLPMTNDKHNILLLGRVNKMINATVEDKMFRFWNQIYEDYYSSEHCAENKHDEL